MIAIVIASSIATALWIATGAVAPTLVACAARERICGDPRYCQARLLAARWRVYKEKNPYKQANPVLAVRIALGEETRRVAPVQNEVETSD